MGGFSFFVFWTLWHQYWNSEWSFALLTTFYWNLFWRGVSSHIFRIWTFWPQSIELTYHSWQSKATNRSKMSQHSRGWLKPSFPLPAYQDRWPRIRHNYVVLLFLHEDISSVPSDSGTYASLTRSLCRMWWSTPTIRSILWSGTCRRARSPWEPQNKIQNL